MTEMLPLLERLYCLRNGPATPGGDTCAQLLCEELPFTVHEYDTGSDVNGWIVPDFWYPERAEIWKDGQLIFDGMQHPMAVISSSASFTGTVSLEELTEHLFWSETRPNAFVYHFRLFYRPWEQNWGFCMPWNQVKTLEDGDYEVIVETHHGAGTMKVCDYLLEGDSADTIVLNAHNCHAGMANDDMSGVVVGVEVMRRLQQRSNRRFSYRLVIGAENIASAHFLAARDSQEVATFREGLFLEGLGVAKRFSYQRSYTGGAELDAAMENVLRHRFPDHIVGDFRRVIGNDETVWEGPGYEIPFGSLSRSTLGGIPFEEYHTSDDNMDIMLEESLEASVEVVLDAIDCIETNRYVRREYKGHLALSNPRYDLYMDALDPSVRVDLPAEARKWNYLMVCLPRSLEGDRTILDIANEHHLPYASVRRYIEEFVEKGLITMHDGPTEVADELRAPRRRTGGED